jgi:HK97 family phage major capsid protein
MNKKMRELLAKMEQKRTLAKAFSEGENKDLEKAKGVLDEIDELKKEYEIEKRLFESEKADNEPDEEAVKNSTVDKSKGEPDKKDAVKEFAEAARMGFKVKKTMTECTPADGGYTVPEDIQTKINEYKTAKASLLDLVTVEKVNTFKGARTFKARANQTGFTKVGEGGKIGKKNTPQFSRLTFEIDKYAGYFPVTNELLADSDANIADTLVTWIGDESRVTANKLILAEIAKKAEVKLEGIDDIKKALNVTLGSAFKATSVIVTNDDGLQYLDTLKDNDGNYLLSPNPSNPLELRLAAGATTVPVKVYPNADLESAPIYTLTADTDIDAAKTYYTKAGDVYTAVAEPLKVNIATYYEVSAHKLPFLIGDFKEAIVFWDRQLTSIAVSDIAVVGTGDDALNAFEEDLTIFRAIEREDVTQRDAAAYVNGYIDTTPVVPAG